MFPYTTVHGVAKGFVFEAVGVKLVGKKISPQLTERLERAYFNQCNPGLLRR